MLEIKDYGSGNRVFRPLQPLETGRLDIQVDQSPLLFIQYIRIRLDTWCSNRAIWLMQDCLAFIQWMSIKNWKSLQKDFWQFGRLKLVNSNFLYARSCWKNEKHICDAWLSWNFYQKKFRLSSQNIEMIGVNGETEDSGGALMFCSMVPDMHRKMRQSVLQRTALNKCQTTNIFSAWHSSIAVRRSTG